MEKLWYDVLPNLMIYNQYEVFAISTGLYGFDPLKDPFDKLKPIFSKLFDLAYELEKKGVIFKQKWGNEEVGLDRMISVTWGDIERKGVDLTCDPKMEDYYKKRKGGALATTTSYLTETILTQTKVKLNPEQENLIKRLKDWTNERLLNPEKRLTRDCCSHATGFPSGLPAFQMMQFAVQI